MCIHNGLKKNSILISLSHSYADEILHIYLMISFTVILRAATIDFYHVRPPQKRQHFWCAAAAAFYDTESRHDCGLADLISCGDADTKGQ